MLYTLTGKELFNDDFLIFVSGGDVYTSGYESCGNGKSAARIWKNNTELYDLTGNFVTGKHPFDFHFRQRCLCGGRCV